MTAGLDRMRADAAARGLAVTVRARPAARSLDEAAALMELPPSRLVKSLVVRRGEGDYLFALVPGDRSIAWPKLRAVVGVNRLAMPPADEALAATGYERGTITPVGATGGVAGVRRRADRGPDGGARRGGARLQRAPRSRRSGGRLRRHGGRHLRLTPPRIGSAAVSTTSRSGNYEHKARSPVSRVRRP
ncbi:aminoacyl-tRNA deacylase [Tsukamurella strandjordii]|uniref:aminoacyl-tRNA deacylase n=1 Tax=Tsukamurella strandjordii TaxID=147577 RepID=UPI0031D45B15